MRNSGAAIFFFLSSIFFIVVYFPVAYCVLFFAAHFSRGGSSLWAEAHHFSIFALNFRTQFCGGSSLLAEAHLFQNFSPNFRTQNSGGSSLSKNSQISEPNFAEARHFSLLAPIFRTQFSAAPQAPHAPLLPAPPPATATFSHFSPSRKNYFFSRAPRLFSYLALLSRYRCAEPPRRAATTPLSLSFGYLRYHLPFTIFLLPQSFYTLHIPTCAQKFTLHTHTLH